MTPLLTLGLLCGIPLVLFLVLRIKPLYLFVSIVTGYFWVTFLGESAALMLSSLVHISNPDVIIRLVLLLLPVVLTLLLMRKSLSASSLPFQFILLVANSLLLATFLVPLLSMGTQQSMYQTQFGSIFRQSHDVIIAGVAALHLLVMFIMRPRHNDAAHGHKKH